MPILDGKLTPLYMQVLIYYFEVAKNSFQQFPRNRFLMVHYYHSLLIDATIVASKNCSITGEHVGIIVVTQ